MINKGDLLIAEPNVLSDINFNRSVILIVESNQNGSVGFILGFRSTLFNFFWYLKILVSYPNIKFGT